MQHRQINGSTNNSNNKINMMDESYSTIVSRYYTNNSPSKSAGAASKISDQNCNTFPWRVHFVLERAEEEGWLSVISWLPGNDSAFKVHDVERFSKQILNKYFQQSKFSKFYEKGKNKERNKNGH
jgi:hypothetical protein